MFEFTLVCMGNGRYECPPDAGPAWREACDACINMYELVENLRLTPWERMVKHQKKLNELLKFEAFMSDMQRGWNFIRSQHGHTH